MSKNVAVCHARFGRVALLQMQCALVVHAHSQAHLLFNVGESSAGFSVRDEDLRLDRAHYVAVNPWEPHSYPHREGESPLILALYIDSEALRRVCPNGRFGTNEAPLTPALRRIVHLLCAEIIHGNGADSAFVEELVDELLSLTLAAPLNAASAPPLPRVSDYRIRRSIAYMKDNVGGRCEIADIARTCGLSREHFFVRFQAETSLTPVVYWNMLKMEQALSTLSDSNDPVCHIAYDLGFSAPGNFTRFFTRHQGVPPLDYRRAARRSVHA